MRHKKRDSQDTFLNYFFSDSKNSFTLVETIVVLAIIAVVSTMTIVSFTLVDSRRIKSEMFRMLSDFSWTREMAISKHQDYTISFDTSNDTYDIRDASGNLAKPTVRLNLVDITTAPNTITFESPFGRMSLNPNNADTITLVKGSKTIDIQLFKETGYARFDLSGGGAYCFIATAAYSGEPDRGVRELRILRRFRDSYLLKSLLGRKLVEVYYTVSPPLADYISKRPWARKITMILLKPVVWSCERILESTHEAQDLQSY